MRQRIHRDANCRYYSRRCVGGWSIGGQSSFLRSSSVVLCVRNASSMVGSFFFLTACGTASGWRMFARLSATWYVVWVRNGVGATCIVSCLLLSNESACQILPGCTFHYGSESRGVWMSMLATDTFLCGLLFARHFFVSYSFQASVARPLFPQCAA